MVVPLVPASTVAVMVMSHMNMQRFGSRPGPEQAVEFGLVDKVLENRAVDADKSKR